MGCTAFTHQAVALSTCLEWSGGAGLGKYWRGVDQAAGRQGQQQSDGKRVDAGPGGAGADV